jgi:hypothetical protein
VQVDTPVAIIENCVSRMPLMLRAAALASSAAGTDVTKVAFISRTLRELGVALRVGNELVYREGLHVYAAAGARIGMHVLLTKPVHAWACMCC